MGERFLHTEEAASSNLATPTILPGWTPAIWPPSLNGATNGGPSERNSMTRRPRIDREAKTVAAMIDIYCRERHGSTGDLCDECRALNDYAEHRLDKCPFQEGKTTCGNCRVHCYRPDMREAIRKVMRYSGPKMVYRHPVMAVRHVSDKRRKRPMKKAKG